MSVTNDIAQSLTEAQIEVCKRRIQTYRDLKQAGIPDHLCDYFIDKFTEEMEMHQQRLGSASEVVLIYG